MNQTAVVNSAPVVALTDSVTPTTTAEPCGHSAHPGADRTNSMAMITDYVPGAYMVHDMLHVRGGHQYSWLIDGVPVPNTNIAEQRRVRRSIPRISTTSKCSEAATMPNMATERTAFSMSSLEPALSATENATWS